MSTESSSFKERMSIVARLAGNATELSRKTGISRRAIGTYLAGSSDPTRQRLVDMASVAGVSVEWLATGMGDIEPSDVYPRDWDDLSTTPSDKQLLAAHKEEKVVGIPHFTLEVSGVRGDLSQLSKVGEVNVKSSMLSSIEISTPDNLQLVTLSKRCETPVGIGNSVLLDVGQKLSAGDSAGVYLMNMDGNLQLRMAQGLTSNKVNVLVCHGDDFEAKEFSFDQLEIVGKVVWTCGIV